MLRPQGHFGREAEILLPRPWPRPRKVGLGLDLGLKHLASDWHLTGRRKDCVIGLRAVVSTEICDLNLITCFCTVLRNKYVFFMFIVTDLDRQMYFLS